MSCDLYAETQLDTNTKKLTQRNKSARTWWLDKNTPTYSHMTFTLSFSIGHTMNMQC